MDDKTARDGEITIRIGNDDAASSPGSVPNLPSNPTFSNPGVVGLAGFGLTTFILQLHSFGWAGVGPTIWLGLVFGGSAQLLSGLQEFYTGNNFGYSTSLAYGSFWIAYTLLLIGDHYGVYQTSATDRGTFMFVFTFYTLFVFVASLGIHLAMSVLYGTLLIGYILLDFKLFLEGAMNESNASDSYRRAVKAFQILAAIDLVICAFCAWYIALHSIYKQTIGIILPLGPAPFNLIKRKLVKKNNVQTV